ncbi:phospholipase D family protein [Sphingomonas sp. ERG5]|uniref:phospholipase D family protein n=1 Tax=Sphingomonas sp. ERG5 TaxID=1381597 RepID=UPI000A7715B2|nr:phospholipase D family protein [Sphingomonas sp. ERG5]
MNVELLNSKSTAHVLKHLISKYDEIHIAVAWGYNGDLSDHLLINSHKFSSVTFGLNGFATSPDLVDRLINVKGAYIAKAKPGIFHPKIYYFQSDEAAEAVIGSANFTKGGLDRNLEACVHLAGAANDKIFRQLRDELTGYEVLRRSVTKPLAESYRQQFDVAAAKRGPRDPVLPDDKAEWKSISSTLATMSWNTFASQARLDPHHNFKKRMKLLREIQGLFANASSFEDMSVAEWKGVAGVLGKRERQDAELDHHDWGWFGSMGGNGDFASRVGSRDGRLSAAVDAIPRKDPVTRDHFQEYCDKFELTFADADHKGDYATATRLLAMKRPDTFVCVNGKNKATLAKALGFAPSMLKLKNYWDRVIEPIRISPWYNAPRPSGRNQELWDYRVAMLDTIYYDQNAK